MEAAVTCNPSLVTSHVLEGFGKYPYRGPRVVSLSHENARLRVRVYVRTCGARGQTEHFRVRCRNVGSTNQISVTGKEYVNVTNNYGSLSSSYSYLAVYKGVLRASWIQGAVTQT